MNKQEYIKYHSSASVEYIIEIIAEKPREFFLKKDLVLKEGPEQINFLRQIVAFSESSGDTRNHKRSKEVLDYLTGKSSNLGKLGNNLYSKRVARNEYSYCTHYISDETLIKMQNALFRSKGYVSRKGILMSVVKDEIKKRFPDSHVIQNGQWSNYTNVEERQLLLIGNILIWA